MEVNRKQFSEITGYSERQISTFMDEGMPAERPKKKGAAVRIRTAPAIKWLLERAGEQTKKEGESQRERLYREQADEKALANARERGQLIYRAHVRDALLEIAHALAGALDGLAGRLANELAHSDARTIRERLLFEHRRVRTDLARAISEYVVARGGDDPIREADPASAGKNAGRVGRSQSRNTKRKGRARKVAKR